MLMIILISTKTHMLWTIIVYFFFVKYGIFPSSSKKKIKLNIQKLRTLLHLVDLTVSYLHRNSFQNCFLV